MKYKFNVERSNDDRGHLAQQQYPRLSTKVVPVIPYNHIFLSSYYGFGLLRLANITRALVEQ